MTTALSSRERIELALEGKPVDHVPFCPFLAYVWEHMPKETQERGQLAFHQRIGADPLWRGAPCPVRSIGPAGVETVNRATGDGRNACELRTPVGKLQMAWQRSDSGNTSFLVEHPLKTEADFKVLLWLEENTHYELDLTGVRQHLQADGREGLSIGMLVPRGKSAFQSLIEHHVGTEELTYALADYPDTVDALWQVMVAKDLEAARLAAGIAEYQYFLTWEDSSTQNYSPALYQKYIGAEIRQWCRILAGQGKRYVQHACGHLKALVPLMRQDGVWAVESLSPPPTGNLSLAEARRMAGNAMGIVGGIEPTLFLNYSVAQLRPYAEQVLADGRGGPYVLANSDSCPPGVTEEKFRAVAAVARQAAP